MKTIYFVTKKIRKPFMLMQFSMMFFISSANAQNINVYATFSDSLRALELLGGKFYFSGLDTQAVSFIEIKIAMDEDSVIVNQQIEFDNPGSVPNGFFYERIGNHITIGFSRITTASTYYCSVRLRDNNALWSNPINFIAN